MPKFSIYILGALLGLWCLASCNSNTYEEGEATAQSVAVYSFSVRTVSGALKGVDTVFFSVDLVHGKIFNADSLPYGTRVNGLIASLRTLEGLSGCEFLVPAAADGSKPDTVINYITNPSDSIDFSRGTVGLRLTSPDGLVTRTYEVDVNVHKQKADSLSWGSSSYSDIPTQLNGAVAATGSALTADHSIVILTADADGNYCLAKAPTPEDKIWDFITPTFPAPAVASSLNGGKDGLFILGQDGSLMRSTDGGQTWSTVNCPGKSWSHIYAPNPDGGDIICSVEMADGSYRLAQAVSGAMMPLPAADFPVSGCSQTVSYEFTLGLTQQIGFTGGRTAAGTLTNASWAFDGTNWVKMSAQPVSEALEGAALVVYTTTDESNKWNAAKYTSLLLFGGRRADGTVNRTVYVSRNYGMNWHKADIELQLPEMIPAVSGGRSYRFDVELTSSLKAIRPVEEWDAPYIYFMGGELADGTPAPAKIWRGALLRLTYKPLI